MNSADALLKTLIANGLEVVFANPGTSEMHLVAAIDHHPDIFCVVTGATYLIPLRNTKIKFIFIYI